MYKEFITEVSKKKEKINQNVFQLQATAEQDIDNKLQDESCEACLMHCTHCTQQ